MVVTLFSIGGATETVVALSYGLKEKGYDVDIVTGPPLESEGDMFSTASKLGLDVIIIPTMVRNIHPIKDLITFFSLVRLIRKGSYRIVHTNSSKAGVLGRWAAWVSNIPIIIHTIHGLPFHEFQPPWIRKGYIYFERVCARISTALVAVSQSIIEECVRANIGSRKQYHVIRSGFDVEQFLDAASYRDEYRCKYHIEQTHIAIGTISRLAELKGHEFILDIAPILCKEFPRLKFVFIGDGEIRELLKARVRQLRLTENVIFTGLIDPNEIPKMIAAMDIIIHLSLREGLARVLPQAIISGKKVVTFDIPGVSEVISDIDTGYRILPKDKDELLRVCRMICNNAVLRVVDRKYSDALAIEFSVHTMVQQTSDLYKSLSIEEEL
jgi:glycosyltransferase involved in cell wall biosynthesis